MSPLSPDSQGQTSAPVWSYRYNVQDEELTAGGLGVPHVFEGPAVFGPQMLPPLIVSPGYWSYNAGVVPLVMKYWLSFVITLNPNTFKAAEAPMWEPWGANQNRLVIQTDHSIMEAVGEGEKSRCGFWKSIAEDTKQ